MPFSFLQEMWKTSSPKEDTKKKGEGNQFPGKLWAFYLIIRIAGESREGVRNFSEVWQKAVTFLLPLTSFFTFTHTCVCVSPGVWGENELPHVDRKTTAGSFLIAIFFSSSAAADSLMKLHLSSERVRNYMAIIKKSVIVKLISVLCSPFFSLTHYDTQTAHMRRFVSWNENGWRAKDIRNIN